MTSNHHAPYVLGYTRATMVGTTLITRPSENISQPAAPRTAGHFKPNPHPLAVYRKEYI